jgi:starch synthase
MYSQRYGTLPIVRKTGGLADTVVDALPDTIKDGTASGLVFNDAVPGALMETIKRSLVLYANQTVWKSLQRNAMSKDFSWENSANQYLALYNEISA